MAILPVSQLQNQPDIVGNFQRGIQFGTSQRLQRQKEQEQQQLRQLAPSIMQGDPAAFSQAAAINPEAAGQYLDSGDRQYRRLKNVTAMLDNSLKSNNPQAAQAAWSSIRPFLQQLAPQAQVPEQWDESLRPGYEQFKNRIAMAEGGGDQQRNLSVSPGSAIVNPATGEVVYERPFAPQQQSFEFAGPDGRPRRYTFNSRTGQYEEAALGQSGSQQAPMRFRTSSGEVIDVGQVADPALRQQILANPEAFGMTPDGGTVQLPGMQATAPLVGRSPEEQAALTTAATEGAKLPYLAQQEAIKTQAAIQQAGGTATAKGRAEAQLEAQQNLPRVMQESDNTISLIDRALNHPGRAAATGASSRLDPSNYIPGTQATDFKVLLDQIKGGTFLQAFQNLKGGGAITETEGKKAEQAIARLNTEQSDEAFIEGLNDLKAIANRARERAIERASGNQAAPGSQGRTVVRRGTLNGRPVVQYSDGTTDYAD